MTRHFTILLLLLVSLAPARALPGRWAVRVSVADVHKDPKAKSEQVTQALLGDEVQVVRRKGPWTSIRVIDQSYKHKGYPGWILDRNLAAAPVGDASRLVQAARAG